MTPSEPRPGHVALREAAGVWAQVALNSFGGPAGQIAVMHRLLVEKHRWISERRFLHALNYCMLLPGPEAQQLATYVGWLMHGIRGGLVAGGLFVLPGFIAIMALSVLYASFRDTLLIEALFYGVKPAVMAIVVGALIRLGRNTVRNPSAVTIAAGAFVAIFFLDIPFPAIVATAALVGYAGGRVRPGMLAFSAHPVESPDENPSEPLISDADVERIRPSTVRSIRTLTVGLALWLTPLAALAAVRGVHDIYTQIAGFFSTAAVVTFGGAYSVLAYIAQQAVQAYGWLQPGEMIDGLGMAESTPGPLIMVVQFVGFMGAYRDPGQLDPLAAGALGAVLTTWVTFAPCFLWIFLGAPYIEYLRGNRSLTAALSGITAAVVGVIANLAVWFSLQVLFRNVDEVRVTGLRLFIPDWATLDPGALALAALAFYLLFVRRWPMLATLGASAAAGFAGSFLAQFAL